MPSSSPPPPTCTLPMVRSALEAGVHVFCEKPFTLDDADGTALTALAAERGLVTQVGYHNRFVAAFGEAEEAARRPAPSATSPTSLAEAYGPVVLAPQGRYLAQPRSPRAAAASTTTRRTRSTCVQWYLGSPTSVAGSRAQPDLLRRDRRRGRQHPHVPRRRHRPGVGQLVGRVAAQDDHQDQRVGHRGPHLRRPPGAAGLPPRHRTRAGGLPHRAGTSGTPPSSASSRGSTCAARSTARRPTPSSDESRRVAARAPTPSRPGWRPTASSPSSRRTPLPPQRLPSASPPAPRAQPARTSGPTSARRRPGRSRRAAAHRTPGPGARGGQPDGNDFSSVTTSSSA